MICEASLGDALGCNMHWAPSIHSRVLRESPDPLSYQNEINIPEPIFHVVLKSK
jgi:hypothetical protein